MADEERLEEVQRWTAKRRVALVTERAEGRNRGRRSGAQARAHGVRDRTVARSVSARCGECAARAAQRRGGVAGREKQASAAQDRRLTMGLEAVKVRPWVPGTSEE